MRRPILLALALVAARSAPGGAVECRVIAGGAPSLAQVDARVRLEFIQRELRLGARKARIWSWGWAAAFSAIATGEAVVSLVSPAEQRGDSLVGGAAALVGLLTVVIAPLPVMRDQRWLDRRVARALPAADPCALLADAERLLLRDAAGEQLLRGWYAHVATLLFNVGTALIIGFGFGHGAIAALNAAAGSVIGEVKINTQPTHSIDALARYRAGELTASGARADAPAWFVLPVASRDTAGLGVVVRF